MCSSSTDCVLERCQSAPKLTWCHHVADGKQMKRVALGMMVIHLPSPDGSSVWFSLGTARVACRIPPSFLEYVLPHFSAFFLKPSRPSLISSRKPTFFSTVPMTLQEFPNFFYVSIPRMCQTFSCLQTLKVTVSSASRSLPFQPCPQSQDRCCCCCCSLAVCFPPLSEFFMDRARKYYTDKLRNRKVL